LSLKTLCSWESKQIQEITRRDVLAELDRLMDRGAPYQANRTLACVRKLFNWCIERGYIATSPAANIKAPGLEKYRDRVLTDEELRAVWEACDAVGYPAGPYVRLLILAAARRGELAGMQRDHIGGDLWRIPQTKNDRPHAIPLTAMAQSIINDLPLFGGSYMFTSDGGRKPINGFSKLKTALDRVSGVTDWRLHDLRRTAATGIAALGFPPHVVERILNHVHGGFSPVAAVYNRHAYQNEMRAALEAWDRKIQGIVTRQSGRVVPMARR
jgi:integrase